MALIRKSRRETPKLDFEVTYKNYEELSRFLTDRAKILGRSRSGLSAKEQRRVSLAIKRARHLALLPYKPGL